MPGSFDKRPSDPELEFGALADERWDELPTQRLTPVRGTAAPPRRATPQTMPAPAFDPVTGVHPATLAPPRASSTPTALRPGAGPERWPEDDDLFGPLAAAVATASSQPPLSDRPTQEIPVPPRPQRTAVAPPPPRLPTLGPEPEFSFGLEPDVLPAPTASSARTEPEVLPLPIQQLASAPASPDERTPVRAHPALSAAAAARVLAEPPARPDPRRELQDRFALGDFSGALVLAEALLADTPRDAEVQRIAEDCRHKLQQMYLSRLGSVAQVPVIAVPRSELKWLSLDHRAGFVLSLVDGHSSVEELLDVASMPALEVLRTLFELLSQRVIELKAPRR
jgi:hypothetical protein